jgi:hypothetical protein
MSEASLRQALSAAIIAAVAGVAALALGAFVAPLPSPTIETSATQVVTAISIRGVLALLALALSLALAYIIGFRIESADTRPAAAPAPKPDPSASSPLVSLFTTPGTRRDAIFAGSIVMGVYWLITTLYILALGKIIGNVGVAAVDMGSFVISHVAQGLILIIAGMGCGGLGSRASLARKLTRRALTGSTASVLPPAALDSTAPSDPAAPQS